MLWEKRKKKESGKEREREREKTEVKLSRAKDSMVRGKGGRRRDGIW